MDILALQRRLSVTPDGHLGPISYSALFARFGAKAERAAKLGAGAATAFPRYGLLEGSGLRLAHFMGQVAHESGGFHYMQEIWGPTPAQRRYEGRRDLGNVHPGDGARYLGRGPLQLTGRHNYRAYGEALGLDLEGNPEIAAQPEVGILIACHYWGTHNLNALADRDDIRGITRKINGGQNGLVDREARTAKAKALIL